MPITPNKDADKMHTKVVLRSCGFVNVGKKSTNFVGHQEQEDEQEEEKNEEGVEEE